MIFIREVTLAFGHKKLFNEISGTIGPKDRIALVGSNGAGKTTLLRMLMGEVQPDEGAIEKPDYATAVELVGKGLGLPFGKKGVDVVNGDTASSDASSSKTKALDESRLTSDPEYRAAYTNLRQNNAGLKRTDITHNMIVKQLERARSLRIGS